MGRAAIEKPKKLGQKLANGRHKLGFSQNEMIRNLGYADKLTQAEISAFERDVRTPPLLVLLRYARAFGVTVDDLIDDKIGLSRKK